MIVACLIVISVRVSLKLEIFSMYLKRHHEEKILVIYMVLSSNPTLTTLFFWLSPCFVGDLASLQGMPLTKLGLYECYLIEGTIHMCMGVDQ